MALKQHEDMYVAQKGHVNADHDRQAQMSKAAIEAGRMAEMMQLDQDYQRGLMGLQHSAEAQAVAVSIFSYINLTFFQIESESASLSLYSLQVRLFEEYQAKAAKWSLTTDIGFTPQLAEQVQ